MNTEEQLILVDELDNEIGTAEKMFAHENGLLHRAFSVFLFNKNGDLLLQQRALEKYHSGGLWTNTCCSHPLIGETIEAAIARKLLQEMGIECNTTFAFKFKYKVQFSNNLFEHELDYVFIGAFDSVPNPNPDEVMDWKYENLNKIKEDILQNPENYTEWFKICFSEVLNFHKFSVQKL